ncbi:hypothetical protein F0562_017851 [Nyssa sinensis]|uniref:Pre-mRNA-splicing factor SLU7 n=1 Tax=Nyssa sinensis TaxID=561372 RepID=A0A5J4ZHG4_9ASTE|nr:hypothetical protein F0562_017851 [Nyssa sinensis]
MEFAKVEKRVCTTGGGSTGSVKNLHIREDTTKYLLNLDLESAHYDPKTRSMREDPIPDMDPNDKFYGGDNQCRISGQALELKQLNIHAWEAIEKGQCDVHMQESSSHDNHNREGNDGGRLVVSSKTIKLEFPRFSRDDPTDWFTNFSSSKVLPKPRKFHWPPTTWKERPTSGGSGFARHSKKKDAFSHGRILKMNSGLILGLQSVKILMKLFQESGRKALYMITNANLNAWAIGYEDGLKRL